MTYNDTSTSNISRHFEKDQDVDTDDVVRTQTIQPIYITIICVRASFAPVSPHCLNVGCVDARNVYCLILSTANMIHAFYLKWFIFFMLKVFTLVVKLNR